MLLRTKAWTKAGRSCFDRIVRRSFAGTAQNHAPKWRPATALDEYVERPIHPMSLQQLFFFGRTLTEDRLISSANYVRNELPTRIAHRIRDMQKLPYAVVTNPHMSHVYELYYKSFESFRKIPVVKTVEDNDVMCKIVGENLKEHLTVIPRLIMGVLECQNLMPADDMDALVNRSLRARISRRVIAEQHLALTDTYHSPGHSPHPSSENDFVGEVLLRCNAQDIIRGCATFARRVCQDSTPGVRVPEITIKGHLDATFPYVLSHLEYIIGELLRNSIQAVMTLHKDPSDQPPPPIEVLICEAPKTVVIRISDQGGGIPRDILPYLWSFNKGPRTQQRLASFGKVPALAATMQEVKVPGGPDTFHRDSSLGQLAMRDPKLRLGMGLPMSKVYAEYWAGALELHSLEGYGVDAFLQISKIGNQNEQLTSRASIDAV